MSRPYKEVILFNNWTKDLGTIKVDTHTNYKLKQNALHVLWRGSIDQFIRDFELPEDAVISSKAGDAYLPGINYGSDMILNWDLTTINFKFNYHVWYKDGNANGYYLLGSNNTIDITVPNVICFNGDDNDNLAFSYASTSAGISGGSRIYNPNIFPLYINISSFSSSNKENDFQAVTGSGTDSLCYLIFRFGVSGDDIQICLQTKNSNAFQVNSESLIIPYASLTFTGFNKIKRLRS